MSRPRSDCCLVFVRHLLLIDFIFGFMVSLLLTRANSDLIFGFFLTRCCFAWPATFVVNDASNCPASGVDAMRMSRHVAVMTMLQPSTAWAVLAILVRKWMA
ncbi:hypothetical protein QQ045_010293 [Rhodiola kirilowii]